ncbi:MAG: calcium-binding protein [Alphaproteobacteria bacterium]|nr:calcium-binding protein [Alphaproteobacteria bacterium]
MATLIVTATTNFGPVDFFPNTALQDVDEIVFDSTQAGFVIASFDASLFDDVRISQTVQIIPDPDFGVTFSEIHVTNINGTFSASGWTFPVTPVNIFLFGSEGDDTITGNSLTMNAFLGGKGADTLIGGDTFRNSFVYGDPLDLAAGETVTGGAGLDVLEVAGMGGNFNFSVATLTDIDRITFIPGLDPTRTTVTVTGAQIAAGIESIRNDSGGPVTLNVIGSAVDLSALAFISWDASSDRVTINGTGGVDTLIGSKQRDIIKGNGGNDTLRGGVGDDTLIGGKGRDIMFGDGGEDIFDFNAIAESKTGAQRDKINHFQRGKDHIDLKGIDAKTGIPGNQKFTWIGKKDFSDTKGELRYKDLGSKVIVQGDVNGDGKADFEIFVKAGSLSKGDFFL